MEEEQIAVHAPRVIDEQRQPVTSCEQTIDPTNVRIMHELFNLSVRKLAWLQ